MPYIRTHGDTIEIDLRVQPRASRARIGPVHDNRIKVAVTAPPVDGAANDGLIALWSKALRVPKRAVQVVRGQSSRQKTIRIQGVTRAAVLELLQ